GESGVITKRAIAQDARSSYKVAGFVDDDSSKSGKTLEGVRIHHAGSELKSLLTETEPERLIISIQNISSTRKREIIEECLSLGIEVQNVPPVKSWIDGKLSLNQIRNIRIEELLEREPIRLDIELIRMGLRGKTILVTGGAGSIGSEIVRQLLPFEPNKVIALDQAESPLYELELQVKEQFKWEGLETVVADVRQVDRMKRVFEAFRPDVVFHAA
ncbi:MAG: polysaccharide biosynthesis protein, partial [Bacteroidota bacterium]